MEIRIRDALPGDADDVARLMEPVGGTLKAGDSRARQGLEDFLADDGVVLVAETGGAVVGACTLLLKRMNPMDEKPGAWLDGLVVDEPYRRRGIARALMAEARTRAEAAGCDSIVLHTHLEQIPALSLYRDLGFRRHGILMVRPLDG